jgi:hypothetical protein
MEQREQDMNQLLKMQFWTNNHWEWATKPNPRETRSCLKIFYAITKRKWPIAFSYCHKWTQVIFSRNQSWVGISFIGWPCDSVIPRIQYQGKTVLRWFVATTGHIDTYVMGYDTRPLLTRKKSKFCTLLMRTKMHYLQSTMHNQMITVRITERINTITGCIYYRRTILKYYYKNKSFYFAQPIRFFFL